MPRRWDIIIGLIKDNNCRRIAEIGVCKGQTAIPVLKACPELVEYILVDPDKNDDVAWAIKGYPCANYMILTSKMAHEFVEDRSLDLIFIDALHDYESVRDDIGYWLPKVKHGGIMCGHDYENKRFPGVSQAVHEVFDEVLSAPVKACKVWIARVE
ncbi:MAG: class I SAM-dependent methyltransferase [Candidatus Thorarchaeota archaeon]|jgi:predicted O-methyltransferase YrrM